MRSDRKRFWILDFGFWISRTAAVVFTVAAVSHAAFAQSKADEPDAVILKWDQTWAVNNDGSLTFHEARDVQINSDRAHGEFADPRITFNADTQKVKIITARTRLSNKTIDVPEYSRNEVSPGGPAGWPAFANIHQIVLTYSGIEPGCVVELDYEVTTAKGAWSEFAGEVRLDHRYPIRAHSLTIANPNPTQTDYVNCQIVKRAGQDAVVVPGETKMGGTGPLANSLVSKRSTVGLGDMQITQTDEPQCPPWQTCRPRFVFSATLKSDEWVRALSAGVESAAKEDAVVTKLASEWTKSASEPSEKLRALQEKLAGTFNFVDFPIAWRNARTPRKAAEVAVANYGVGEESAALLISFARAAGLKARPGLLVSSDVWREDVPQDGFVSAFVALVDTGGATPEVWHPQSGKIVRDKRWAGSRVFSTATSGVETTELAAWTDPNESNCRLSGDLTIHKDGAYSAKVRLRMSGLFVARESLRTSDQQKARAAEVIGRIVPNADVSQCNVRTLTDTTFDADVELKSRKPLALTDGFHRLTLPQDGPLLGDLPMPLTYATRTQPVRLTGAGEEQIELTIHWPAGWTVEATPAAVPSVSGAWGAVEQSVKATDDQMTLTRRTRLAQREIAAADFLSLRAALNQERAEFGRTLLLLPTKTP